MWGRALIRSSQQKSRSRIHIRGRFCFADSRAILDLLSAQPLTLNGVAEHFDISRPAISRHVKILVECGVVVVRQRGRERYCEVQVDKLNEVSTWVAQYRATWEQRFDRLEETLNELQQRENSHEPKK